MPCQCHAHAAQSRSMASAMQLSESAMLTQSGEVGGFERLRECGGAHKLAHGWPHAPRAARTRTRGAPHAHSDNDHPSNGEFEVRVVIEYTRSEKGGDLRRGLPAK